MIGSIGIVALLVLFNNVKLISPKSLLKSIFLRITPFIMHLAGLPYNGL